MAKWDVEVTHGYTCGQDEAIEKVAEMVSDFEKQNAGLVKSVKWNADKTEAKADGRGFDAVFSVAGGQVVAQVKLGLALKMMKGKVQSGLEKQLAKSFG